MLNQVSGSKEYETKVIRKVDLFAECVWVSVITHYRGCLKNLPHLFVVAFNLYLRKKLTIVQQNGKLGGFESLANIVPNEKTFLTQATDFVASV